MINKNNLVKEEKTLDIDTTEAGEWGINPQDHMGYASEEERHSKRGLEDWELVEKISESQRGVPYWFVAVILAVLLVAIGLSFPFWGVRPGYERPWIDGGFIAALVYISVGIGFIYFMVHMYGSKLSGRLDSDPENKENHEKKRD